MNNDLYNILELNSKANQIDIRKSYKRLVLKYHPDKNINNNNIEYNNEHFNKIRIAYEILSNNEKKNQYDSMIFSKQNQFTKMIFSFIKDITDKENIQNLMNNNDIQKDIKNGNINKIAKKLIKKILYNIDIEFDIKKLEEIFLYSPLTNDTCTNSISLAKTNDYNSSELDTLNIVATIKVDINDIYHNRIKEIIVKRKVYNNNDIQYEVSKYYIPLYNNEVIIKNAGDKIIKNNNETNESYSNSSNNNSINTGNVIIKIICNNQTNLNKDGNNIIYNDNITLFELFNGFSKNIDYFNSNLNISSLEPFKEYDFDGSKLSICLLNKGLPYDKDNRGNLIINLILNKPENFNSIIKKI